VSLDNEKELGELKSRFVSMASHEFRTPLSTILSSAYLIEKYTSGEDQPKRDNHIRRIISSVKMLTDILNDFLSVGKIEEGKIQVRSELFNITDYMAAVCDEIKNTLKPKQSIEYIHQGDTMFLLDQSLLKHIMLNLISNASKFSKDDGIIRIETSSDDKEIVVSVTDQGIGISQDDQKHLTERFFRASNATAVQGTGLGLHIISKYAEIMDGKVTWNSKINEGTQFVVTFSKDGRI
jgi:signal transduction histidine kinase